mgnify:CR=1 FL=1
MTTAGGGSAQRYARAAFEVATEKRDVKGWETDLDTLEGILSEPSVALALENPRLDGGRRIALVLSLLPPDFNQERSNFVKLLVVGGRTRMISQVRGEFQSLVDDAAGRIELDLVVAVELSTDDRVAITRELSDKMGREVKVNVRVDPEIIGGLIIRRGDHVVDGSVRRRLAEMREELLAG